jgi:hypothetical protein
MMCRVDDETTPATVVDEALRALVAAQRSRNLEGVLALFGDGAALYGSEAGEQAVGTEALRAFYVELLSRPVTFGWEWEHPTAARRDAVVWFVAPGTIRVIGDDGVDQVVAPYRLTGVLVHGLDGHWRFALFSGSEPAPAD